ncbi:MAG TPA: HDOD domain-containing protein [Caldimonas sp.]|jgi:HD-like signal output (HDOD) protein|nr:HDOD domain-containing protein [Caldimonas sp.]HEX2542319.1 HDOD domain-containing protein [Caldimonas sp.]
MTEPAQTVRRELLEPLPALADWVAHFRASEIPVLQETADSLEALRANEDRTDANGIGELIAGDPLMTLKVLAYSSSHRGRRVITAPETVTSALVMLGITPFFRAFPTQVSVEELLASEPAALAGLHRVLQRAHRGADFALAFAVHRTDPNAAAVHAAALLHEFAELLLWCHAPRLALRIARTQARAPRMRSSLAQREVLGVELADLQHALVAEWQLPGLLCEIGVSHQASHAGARTVALAARLARHTHDGWDNPALADDIADVAELLNLSAEATLHLAQNVARRTSLD